MVYMYHSFLIHSSADGHLGCFHVQKLSFKEEKYINMKQQSKDSCLSNKYNNSHNDKNDYYE